MLIDPGMQFMSEYEQEWISPILEAYKKRDIEEQYTVILGLNPLGQAVCRRIYQDNSFETLFVFNSSSFSMWNRYPSDMKPPVVPVHALAAGDLMLVFGDVFIRDHEWIPDLFFYMRGNIPTRFVVGMMSHDAASCGQVLSKKGGRLLERMDIPLGYGDYYDGITGPLLSLATPTSMDPVLLFLESHPSGDIVLQIDEKTVTEEDVVSAIELLEKGLDIRLS